MGLRRGGEEEMEVAGEEGMEWRRGGEGAGGKKRAEGGMKRGGGFVAPPMPLIHERRARPIGNCHIRPSSSGPSQSPLLISLAVAVPVSARYCTFFEALVPPFLMHSCLFFEALVPPFLMH